MFGIFALAFRKDKFTVLNIIVSISGFLIAAGLYYFYQQDSIALMLNTVYPGERSLPGGYLPRYYLWSFFAPHSLINTDFFAISDIRNMCEIAVVGSILIPSVLCFGNLRSLFEIFRNHIWSYSLIFGFIFILFAWMYLPVPASVGQFILFDQINVLRILLTFGSSVIILSAILAYKQEWNFSWFRFLIFIVITLSPPFLAYRHITKEALTLNTNILDLYDYLTIVPIASLILILSFHWFTRKETQQSNKNRNIQIAYTLMLTALVFNIVSFAHFNPLQSTKEIFSKELQNTVTKLKTDLNLAEEDSILYQSHLPYLQTGSILNGLNIPSFNHALLTPQLDFYKKLLPNTDPETFNYALNRYAKTQFSNQYNQPKAIHFDVVGLPTEVAAQPMKVSIHSGDIVQVCQSCDTHEIYPHEVTWKKLSNSTLQLSLNFTSPIKLDKKLSKVEVASSDKTSTNGLNVSAKTIAEVNLPWYFSEASMSVEDITRWNLYINFNRTDVGNLESLPSQIEYLHISTEDNNQAVLIQLQKDIRVEPIATTNSSMNFNAQPAGYIDIATYDPNSGIISLEGWTPVEDTQSARWIGYSSTVDIQTLESKTVFRPGIPLEFGKNLYKGFKIILRTPAQTTASIPLCLYSSTQALGIYTIYSGNVPFLKCSIDAKLETIQHPSNPPQMNGVIDHARLANNNKSLVLTGWALKNKLDDISTARWFANSGSLSPESYQISSQPRPDVAKVFGDEYNMSGFQIVLNFSKPLSPNEEIDFCLYSRSNAKGQFLIPYSQNQNQFYCTLQNK